MSKGSIFDEMIDRRNTASLKWDRYPNRNVIPLWVADMDFASPAAVIEALHRRVDHGVFGYGVAPRPLVETVAGMLDKDYGWKVEPDWIIWLPGLVSALNAACRTAGHQGDEILTATPVYPPFLTAPKLMDRRLLTVDLVQDKGRWTFDFDRLAAAITPRTRMFILCNPHNPTGRVYTKEELITLHRILSERDVLICSDEIHCQLILDADKHHQPLASLVPDPGHGLITLMAPSKTYNLPGLGCSFAVIAEPALRQRFRRSLQGIVPPVNVLGYTAALAAYSDRSGWLADLIDYLRENRDCVAKAIGRMPGLAMSHIEATYLAWIDARKSGIPDPVSFFEQAGVGLSDGRDFGSPGFLRLNFGCPKALLQTALARMQKALEHSRRQIL